MGAVSVFMTGNYPRQPVDEDGPLSLRCWLQLAISLLMVLYSLTSNSFRRPAFDIHSNKNANKKWQKIICRKMLEN